MKTRLREKMESLLNSRHDFASRLVRAESGYCGFRHHVRLADIEREELWIRQVGQVFDLPFKLRLTA